LIVDDDTFNLTALDQILSKLNFTCDWALNGKEAIDKIKIRQLNRCGEACEQYKLMFLDCQMPILNGFETAKLLKRLMSDGEIDYLRIVGCSAFIQEADEKKARQAGMDDFCTKPINVKMIKEKIKANLE
jgi:CheY-like chemotaxis protein